MKVMENQLDIRFATVEDVPQILKFITSLAEYERLPHEVIVTEELLQETLFGSRIFGEVLIGSVGDKAVGFALFFHNYSTFLGRPGIHLEDLFVIPEERGRGYGKALLSYLAQIAVDRKCGRLEWSVLNWNEPAISFYQSLGAIPMDGWTTYRMTGDSLAMLGQAYAK